MAEYVVRWSERFDYSMIVDADSEASAWEKAYESSTFSDVEESQLYEDSIEIVGG
jgi:hypothetical protein